MKYSLETECDSYFGTGFRIRNATQRQLVQQGLIPSRLCECNIDRQGRLSPPIICFGGLPFLKRNSIRHAYLRILRRGGSYG